MLKQYKYQFYWKSSSFTFIHFYAILWMKCILTFVQQRLEFNDLSFYMYETEKTPSHFDIRLAFHWVQSLEWNYEKLF